MSATTTTATVTAPARRPAVLVVVRSGAVAAAAGSAALYLYGLLVQASAIPMVAGEPGAAAAQPVTAANFAVGTVLCTFWGTVLAAVLARLVREPARVFVRAAAGLLVLSLVFPLAGSHTAASTRVALAVGHLLAAAVVVPLLVRALRRP